MTKVIRRFIRNSVLATAFLLLGTFSALFGSGQNPASPATQHTSNLDKRPAIQLAPAEGLYLRLRGVGLDKNRVYRIRDITLDRATLHLTLEDGTIAFTEDADGHVTGAFFEGEGEVLLTPPDRTERASLALFTNEAILEESFSSAYIRFNDDTFAEMQPYLKPPDDPTDFLTKWDSSAQALAIPDALRLLLTFSRDLPIGAQSAKPSAVDLDPTDKYLHARIQGRKLGSFDVCFDSRAPEQLWAGQLRTTNGVDFYDLWTSFNPVTALAKGKGEQGNGAVRSDFLKITDYKIRARVIPPTRIEAEAALHLQVQHSGERAVIFELSRSLQISEVLVNGEAVEYIHNPAIEGTQLARRGNDFVAVIFPKPLETGQAIDLKFRYAGDVLSQAGPGLLYVGARGIWYPNRGLAMANFDLQFRYPQEWTLVATGQRSEQVPADPVFAAQPDDQVSRWVSNRPIPVAGFNLGKYQEGTAKAGDVTVEAFATPTVEKDFPKGGMEIVVPAGTAGFPQQAVVQIPLNPSPARNAQAVAEQAASAVDFYSSHFGPYPFVGLALTQIPGAESQGWPGLIFLSSLSFLKKEEIAQLHMPEADKAIIEQIVSHETAHQWWGDLVGWNGYRDQWWIEALANYSSLMSLEIRDPDKFHAILDKYRDDLLEKNDAGRPLTDNGPVSLGTRLSNSVFPSGYTAISYGRGTWLFHMLRHMLLDAERGSGNEGSRKAESGEEPFLRGLRKLRERYEGKTVTTRELLAIFEEELPRSLRYEGRRSLDWFYAGWISGTAIPKYELKQLKFVDQGGSTTVTGILQQKEAPDDLITAVPLYASRSGKTVFISDILADGPETHFHLTVPAGTRKIVIDPQGTILSRLR